MIFSFYKKFGIMTEDRSRFTAGALAVATLFLVPTIASAQSYVPVFDEDLYDAFTQYAEDVNDALTGANGAEDSIRDIIAGPNPQGVAVEPCEKTTSDAVGPNQDEGDRAFAYDESYGRPWYRAIASSTQLDILNPDGSVNTERDPLPDEIEVEENMSGSLRCLIQELIGYQKISLFVQIQTMLKQYIADAQQKQLSYQLLNQINGAKLNWAKQGNQIETDDALTTEPVFVLNPDATQNTRDQRNVRTLVAQAAANAEDEVGSLELANPLTVAAIVDRNLKTQTDDSRVFATEFTQSNLTDPDSGAFPTATSRDQAQAYMDEYMSDPNTSNGLGSVDMLLYAMNNPQDFDLTAVHMVETQARGRLAQDEKRVDTELQGSGFQPTRKCSGLPTDPYCDPALMVNVSPSSQNESAVTQAVQSGDEQILNSDTLDATSASSSEGLSLEANTEPLGIYGYDSTALQASGNTTNVLIYELYDTIQFAYFDLTNDQTDWASAALLSIYDQMNFNDDTPNVVLGETPQGTDESAPQNSLPPVDLPY